MEIENILVVDGWEEGMLAKLIADKIKMISGLDADVANSLLEGMELLNKKKYNAIVLEPNTASGDAAIKVTALTDEAKKKDTPVVVYTILDPGELERYGLKENRDFYRLFQKPTSIDRIVIPYLKAVAESKSR